MQRRTRRCPTRPRDTGAVIQIRRARLADEDALARVDAVTRTAEVSPAPPPPPGTSFFGPGTLPEDVLVAESEAVIGYAKLTQTIPLASHEHVLLLSGLAVDPDRQRAGVGRRLVEAIRAGGALSWRTQALLAGPGAKYRRARALCDVRLRHRGHTTSGIPARRTIRRRRPDGPLPDHGEPATAPMRS